MEQFKIVPGDLEDRSFNVEGVNEGDVWSFSAENGQLDLTLVIWKSGTLPSDGDARTRYATEAASRYAREQDWLAPTP